VSEQKKIAYFLPNTFTALNLACGFLSIIFSWKGQFYYASMVLVLGSFFDMVDGRVARMTGTQSSFGEQFDSLSDLISFGMAPAFMVYNAFFISYGRLGVIASFTFLLAGALRLARFNANVDKVSSDYFQGLPIPSGAWAIVGYVLWAKQFPFLMDRPYLAFPFVVFYAFLLISNIPFASFKNSDWVSKHKKRSLMIIFIALIALFSYEMIMVGLIINLYVLGCLIYYIKHRKSFKGAFEWDDEVDSIEDNA
jgi:CDP-diacylglycerol--serine O-phosphatidyltransferase